MSNRTALIVGAATVILALLILTNFGRNLPFGDDAPRDPHLPPREKPDRPDRKLLKRFEGVPMPEILAKLREEIEPPPAPAEPELVRHLPEGPYPFDGLSPRNEEALRQVAAAPAAPSSGEDEPKAEGNEAPGTDPGSRWRRHLASLALGDPGAAEAGDFPPAALPGRSRSEPVHAPIELTTTALELAPPLALASLDDTPGLDLVSHGGARFHRLEPGGGEPTALALEAETASADFIVPADYDGDGDDDLFLGRRGGLPDSLLRNDGQGRLADATSETGLLAFADTTAACWTDVDADGRLDLVVGYRDRPLEVYRQGEDGVFLPVSWEMGIWVGRDVESVVAAEIDGRAPAEWHVSVADGPDRFFVATPAETGMRFADMRSRAGIPESEHGAVVHFFDFDNDGDLDLLWGRGDPRGDTAQARALLPALSAKAFLRLFLNDGAGQFTDVTADAGLKGAGAVRSLATVDLDGDGFEEIVAGTAPLSLDRLYWNRLGSGVRDVTVRSGFGWLCETRELHPCTSGGVPGLLAVDGAGTVRRFRNSAPSGGWLTIRLEPHRPGLRVALVVRDRDWVLHPIQRFSGTRREFTVGLGDGATIESIQVYEPGRPEPLTMVEDVEPNRTVSLRVPAPVRSGTPPTAAPAGG